MSLKDILFSVLAAFIPVWIYEVVCKVIEEATGIWIKFTISGLLSFFVYCFMDFRNCIEQSK